MKTEKTYIFKYECIGCKAIIPPATDEMTKDEAKTCPVCKKKAGFHLIREVSK